MASFIYGLTEPETGVVRYVGRTCQRLELRLRNHLQDAKKKDHPRARWIRDLLAHGERPGIVLLETVPDGVDWREVERAVSCRYLGLVNAKRCGAGPEDGARYEWLPEHEAQLGKVADAVLAERIGCTRKAVTYHRVKLGIPASNDRTRNTPPPPMGGHNRVTLPADIVARIGQEPDYRLAAEAGVGKSVVARVRRSMGIEPYATVQGNPTRFRKGQPHPRWSKQR